MTISKSVLGSVAAVSLTVISAFASVPAQTSSCSYTFNSNLRTGAVSTDVQNLQKLLNMDVQTKVSTSGAGSMGYETLRFGPATTAAVKRFQSANGISPVSGYVGPLTRAVLNTICSNSAPVTTNPGGTNTGTGVISNNIPVSVLVAGQANAKLGEFVISGNGSVTGIELMRTGLSNNSTLKNVYLYDGATRLTSASSVLTDGTIRFLNSGGIFVVNGSKTITVKADIACQGTTSNCVTNVSGQTVGVAMKSVTMSGATASTPVVGVNGPLFSISSASLAGANFTTTAPSPSVTSINAGSINQTLWSNNLNISSNASILRGLTLRQIGSAQSNTTANVQLYVDGVSVASASINAANQFVFSNVNKPLTTGSHLIELRGDVVAGAFRNFYISLEEATDIQIEDSTLPGIYVTPTYLTNTLTNLNGGTVSVNKGSLTVNQDTTFNTTTNLVGGATNVKLAAFKFTSYGEDVKVNTLTFTPTFTALSSGTTLSNVGLYVNGGQVGSNMTATNATALTFSNLGTNLLVPAGQTVTVEVRGDVVNSSTNAAITSGTVKFDLAIGSSNAQGMTSYELSSTAAVGGQSLTVQSSNVTFAGTTGFSTSTKAPNSSAVKIGSFTLQTGSAEGVQVTNISVPLTAVTGAITQFTNLTVKDSATGNVIGTPIGNPTGANNFSANVNVPVSSSKTFDVYADFGSPSVGSVRPDMLITYRGLTSNLTSYTNSNVAVTGVVTTVGVASIATAGVTYNTGLSPVAQYAIGGQSAFNIGTYNFKAATSIAGAIIRDVTFTGSANTVGSVTMNGKTASFVGGTATIYNVGVTVPADASGINVPVTVSLANVGVANGYAVNSAANAQVTVTGVTYFDGSNVQTVTAAPSVATPVFLVVASKPTLSVNSSQQTGLVLGQENKIGEVTIAADAAGQIKVNTITFNLGSSGMTGVAFTGTQAGNMRIADGNTTISGSSCTNAGVCTLGTTPNGYTIAAGSSKTFSLYAIVNGTVSGSSIVSASAAVTATGFSWDDVQGGGTSLNGSSIYNFPTNPYSIRQ